MPLAVSATTFSGRSTDRSMNERTWSANAASRSWLDRAPTVAAGGTPESASSLMRSRPGVLANRLGAGQAELDAVVLRRVVRCGEHGAGRIQRARGEVHEVGGGESEVDHVDPLRGDAVGERS